MVEKRKEKVKNVERPQPHQDAAKRGRFVIVELYGRQLPRGYSMVPITQQSSARSMTCQGSAGSGTYLSTLVEGSVVPLSYYQVNVTEPGLTTLGAGAEPTVLLQCDVGREAQLLEWEGSYQ